MLSALCPLSGFTLIGAILYGIFGYLFTALTAWIYNVVAKWTGGVEFICWSRSSH